jgi:hypothetical protein
MWRKEASLTSACFKKMEEKHMHDGTGNKGEQLAPLRYKQPQLHPHRRGARALVEANNPVSLRWPGF